MAAQRARAAGEAGRQPAGDKRCRFAEEPADAEYEQRAAGGTEQRLPEIEPQQDQQANPGQEAPQAQRPADRRSQQRQERQGAEQEGRIGKAQDDKEVGERVVYVEETSGRQPGAPDPQGRTRQEEQCRDQQGDHERKGRDAADQQHDSPGAQAVGKPGKNQ